MLYDKFYAYLADLEQNYDKLAALLQKKLVALEGFDIKTIDSLIKEEQVFVLLSKGFDANIQKHREALGLRGERLSEIIEELPEEETQRFRELFRSLKAALDEVKALQDKCRALIEDRLYTLDKSIKELDRSAAGTYRKTGDAAAGDAGQTHLFTKSV